MSNSSRSAGPDLDYENMRLAGAIVTSVLLIGCASFESAIPLTESDNIVGDWVSETECQTWTFWSNGSGIVRKGGYADVFLEDQFDWHGDRVIFDPFDEGRDWSWEIRRLGDSLVLQNRYDGSELRLWPEHNRHTRGSCS